MDASTGLLLALQLVALCSIAGALLLYLLCKVRAGGAANGPQSGQTKSILVTSADNALGLQIAIHLAERGYRVFAGMRSGEESLSWRLARGWASRRAEEFDEEAVPGCAGRGQLIPILLDVTREDVLHEAAQALTSHLPAGENGLWGIVNTAGVVHVGRLQQQEPAQWEAMLRTNVLGVLRAARTFLPLLANAKGRFLNIGSSTEESGEQQVCYAATRWAVEGASQALRMELKPYGIHVVTLQPVGISTRMLFSAPREIGNRPDTPSSTSSSECSVPISETTEYSTSVLYPSALKTIEEALSIPNPNNSYELSNKQDSWFRRIPSLRSLQRSV